MKRIFLIGATGRAGGWILRTALARGHEVTALVRGSADRLEVSHPALTVTVGDLSSPVELAKLVAGHDAIVSALDSQNVAEGTATTIAAASASGVQRFIGIAGGGILQLDDQRLRRERPGYPLRFLQSSEGHLKAWHLLVVSSLDWTLVCTPDLVNAEASSQAKSLADFMPAGGNAVPLGDVAEFVVNEIENPQYSRRRVGFTV